MMASDVPPFRTNTSAQVAKHISQRPDRESLFPHFAVASSLFLLVFVRITFIPAALLIGFWFLTQLVHAGAVAHVQTGGVAYLAHVGGVCFRGRDRTFVRRFVSNC
jgi:hypothetical protein